MKSVKGKLVLVTGAAMGMGKLTAKKFAGEGARIIIVDLNEPEMRKTEQEIREMGADAWSFKIDVTDKDAIYALAERIRREIGAVDILINNAGIVVAGEFLKADDKITRLHYEVNILGLIWFTKAFLPGMIEKGEGHVVNMASASGLMGVPYICAYVSTKWAVIGFTESIQIEMEMLGHKRIKFSAICPSYVATGMFQGAAPPRLTRFIEPETMARKIFEAVIREKSIVLEPFMVKLTPLLKALLPGKLFLWLAHLLGITKSATNWTGRALPPK